MRISTFMHALHIINIVRLHVGAIALYNSYFGNGLLPQVVTDIGCSSGSSETNLFNCHHNFNAAIYCGESAIASAICPGKQK